jgi:uncharacterized protein YndB with AHSA1/START domain
MNRHAVSHHTIVVKCQVAARVPAVFNAWRDPAALGRWYLPGDDTWSSQIARHEFAVGGVKRIAFGPRDEVPFTEDCRYVDIVTGHRLCFSMTIGRADKRLTTSMVTVEFADVNGRTDLTVTDQLVILDGGDSDADRRRGWGETLAKLKRMLETHA